MSTEDIQAKLTHEAFRQPADDSIKVWRYFDLPKFLALLRSKTLHFSGVLAQRDRYEGVDHPSSMAAIRSTFTGHLGLERGEKAADDHFAFLNRFVEGNYINCWTANAYESEAMWRLYCPGDTGIALQTTYARLRDSVIGQESCYIGLVRYIDYTKQGFSGGNQFHRVMHKRASFSHESEVRLVIARHEHMIAPGLKPPAFVELPWNPETHAEAVFVDPYAPPWFFDVVADVLAKYSLPLSGRLRWSGMR